MSARNLLSDGVMGGSSNNLLSGVGANGQASARGSAPVPGVFTSEKEKDKMLALKMMSALFHHFRDHTQVPDYAGGTRQYGRTVTVNSVGFRDYLAGFLQNPDNVTGRFLSSTPMFNKPERVDEKTLLRRFADFFESQELFFSERALSDGVSAATVALTGSTVVLRDVEQLCSAIVMNDVLDRFVDQLKSDNYKANKGAKDGNPNQGAQTPRSASRNSASKQGRTRSAELRDISITTPQQLQRICDALQGHPSLKAISFTGNELGAVRRTAANDDPLALPQRHHRDKEAETLESRFAESLTSALATVPMLSELVLSCNMLRDQDMSTIGKLTRLQTLNLSNNDIDDSGGVILADALAAMPLLKNLDVSRNSIADQGLISILSALCDKGRKPLSLTVLRLEHNRFRGAAAWTALADAIKSTRSLAFLDVSGNALGAGSEEAELFSSAISQNSLHSGSLRFLHMGSMRPTTTGSWLSSTSSQIASVNGDGSGAAGNSGALTAAVAPQFFGGGANSEVAQVARLGDSVADLLVPVLKNTSCKLHEVSISNSMLTPYGMGALCHGLVSCSTLMTLDLSWNDIREKGVRALVKALRSGRSRITDLDVSYNQIDAEGIARILRLLQKPPNSTLPVLPLRRLVLAGNLFPEVDIDYLITQLSTRTHTLTSLDLSNMRCPGLWKLCKIFPHNRSIRTLKLARNNIHFPKVAQADEFATALMAAPSLTELDLSHNDLSDDGVLAIARKVAQNRTLRQLNVTANNLTKPSAYGLGRALASSPSLNVLDIAFNDIQFHGALALLDMMNANSLVSHVDAGGFAVPFRLKMHKGKFSKTGQGVFHSVQVIDDEDVDEAEEKLKLMQTDRQTTDPTLVQLQSLGSFMTAPQAAGGAGAGGAQAGIEHVDTGISSGIGSLNDDPNAPGLPNQTSFQLAIDSPDQMDLVSDHPWPLAKPTQLKKMPSVKFEAAGAGSGAASGGEENAEPAEADGDFDEGRVAMLVEAIAGDINKMAIMDVRNRVDHQRNEERRIREAQKAQLDAEMKKQQQIADQLKFSGLPANMIPGAE